MIKPTFDNNIFAIIKVRCVVRAHPPANVDWVKQGETVETGGGDDGDHTGCPRKKCVLKIFRQLTLVPLTKVNSIC